MLLQLAVLAKSCNAGVHSSTHFVYFELYNDSKASSHEPACKRLSAMPVLEDAAP